MTVTLRACSVCGGHWLGHRTRGDDPWLCPKHVAEQVSGFDPQPGDRVHHVDRQAGPFSNLLVLERRDDGWLIVQPVGHPDRRQALLVAEAVPA